MSNKSYAPYNFIPFEEDYFQTEYQDESQLPEHNRVKEGLHSGVISYTLENRTPLSIGSNDGKIAMNADREPVIPGSTMRGFIRSHAEVLSFAYPENVDDTTYLTRGFAAKSRARRDAYQKIAFSSEKNGPAHLQETVQAGIVSYNPDSPDAPYTIHMLKPVSGNKTYVPFLEVDLKNSDREYHLHLPHNYYMYTEYYEDDFYENGRIRFHRGTPTRDSENRSYTPFDDGRVYAYDANRKRIMPVEKGPDLPKVTLFNDERIGTTRSRAEGAKKHLYLISAEEDPDKKEIVIPASLVNSFKRDLERNKHLGTTDRQVGNSNRANVARFHSLPEKKGQEKVFFYNYDKSILKSIGTSPYMRVPYTHSVLDPYKKKKPSGISWTDAVFGFANEKSAYRGRVSFTSAVSSVPVKVNDPVRVMSGGPSGSAIQMYVDQNGRNSETLHTYMDPDFRLRGQKFYWKRKNPVRFDDSQIMNKKTLTDLYTVSAGNHFRGKILFENLNDAELGMLLSSLQYKAAESTENEEFMIGKGKPYGYGRVAITDVSLVLIDERKRYLNSSLSDSEIKADNRIEEFKSTFRNTIAHDQKSYESHDSIRIYREVAAYGYAEERPDSDLYMKLNDRNGGPSYSRDQPLEEAEEILSRVTDGKVHWQHQPSGNSDGNTVMFMDVDQSVRDDPLENNTLIMEAVWVGDQVNNRSKKNLEHDIGKSIEPVLVKPDPAEITSNAGKAAVILIPQSYVNSLKNTAIKHYMHVFVEEAKGKRTSWKKLK